jgi:hypothetical protein
MITYTVHEPPNARADRLDRAETLVFVRDGFVWSAAALAPVWLLANRLWLVLIGYIALVLTIVLGTRAAGLGDTSAAVVGIAALHLLIGLEGSSLRRWTLQRRGWRLVGTVVGRTSLECERRFFDQWLPSQPLIRLGPLTGTTMATDLGALPIDEPPGRDVRGGWLSRFRRDRTA